MENLLPINHRKILITITLLLILSACNFKKCDCENYGTKFNNKRKTQGLDLLDSTWTLKVESHELGCTCTWKSNKLAGYAQKEVEISTDGQVLKEIDKYYMDYFSLVDPDDSEKSQVYAYLSYDFKTKEYLTGEWGTVKNKPNYNIETNLFEREIDFLHYIQKIQWNYLPKIDTTKFPLPRE